MQQSGGQSNGARHLSQLDTHPNRLIYDQSMYHSINPRNEYAIGAARTGFFFESPSKYISLKKHNEHYSPG